MMGIRMGVSRGVFSNESGLGSAPIAAAAAQTKHPVTQALVSMTQTFIDTLVVCTMTGLVLILTGAWNSGKTGAALSAFAFESGVPGGHYIVTIGLILFAYSTILGWCYYGEKSIEYILGEKSGQTVSLPLYVWWWESVRYPSSISCGRCPTPSTV
jgi:alanine or glycine:cation symporter, AGCS family